MDPTKPVASKIIYLEAEEPKPDYRVAVAKQIVSTLEESSEFWPIWRQNPSGVKQLVYALVRMVGDNKFGANIYWNGDSVITSPIKKLNCNIWEFHFRISTQHIVREGGQFVAPKADLVYRMIKQFNPDKARREIETHLAGNIKVKQLATSMKVE